MDASQRSTFDRISQSQQGSCTAARKSRRTVLEWLGRTGLLPTGSSSSTPPPIQGFCTCNALLSLSRMQFFYCDNSISDCCTARQEPKVEPKPRITRSRAAGRRGVMSLIAIENHIHLALISLTIAPSTFLAFVVVAFVYLYIVHVRNNPLPRPGIDFDGHGHDRGVGRPIRRPSVFRRFSARLRTRKQRDRSITPLWIPFPSLWLPLRHRIRERRFDFWRQIQPAGMAPRRKRQSQQRLLE